MTCDGKPLLEAGRLAAYEKDLEVVATSTDAGRMLDLYYLGFQTVEADFTVDAGPLLCHHHAL